MTSGEVNFRTAEWYSEELQFSRLSAVDQSFVRWLLRHREWLREKYNHLIGANLRWRDPAEGQDRKYRIGGVDFAPWVDVYYDTLTGPISIGFRRHTPLFAGYPFQGAIISNGPCRFFVDQSVTWLTPTVEQLLSVLPFITKPLLKIISEYSGHWVVGHDWTPLSSWFGYTCVFREAGRPILHQPSSESDALLESILLQKQTAF